MAKRRREWPPWWGWELELTSYTYKRLRERDCREIHLRRMMQKAAAYRPSKREGRWVIETRLGGKPWKAIVEPIPETERLVVVTAYEVEKPE